VSRTGQRVLLRQPTRPRWLLNSKRLSINRSTVHHRPDVSRMPPTGTVGAISAVQAATPYIRPCASVSRSLSTVTPMRTGYMPAARPAPRGAPDLRGVAARPHRARPVNPASTSTNGVLSNDTSTRTGELVGSARGIADHMDQHYGRFGPWTGTKLTTVAAATMSSATIRIPALGDFSTALTMRFVTDIAASTHTDSTSIAT
jgi:hypothetical protein